MNYQSPPSSGAAPLRFQSSDRPRHQSDANASMTQIVHPNGFPHNCNSPSCSQPQRGGPPSHISSALDQQVSFSRFFLDVEFTSLIQRLQSSQARRPPSVYDANCSSMSLADRRVPANIYQTHVAVNQRNAAAMQQPDQANIQYPPQHRNEYQLSAVLVRRFSCLVLNHS